MVLAAVKRGLISVSQWDQLQQQQHQRITVGVPDVEHTGSLSEGANDCDLAPLNQPEQQEPQKPITPHEPEQQQHEQPEPIDPWKPDIEKQQPAPEEREPKKRLVAEGGAGATTAVVIAGSILALVAAGVGAWLCIAR